MPLNSETLTRKPMKLWDVHRQSKHGIVVGSLQEVVEKGRSRLGLSEDVEVRVVLEEDGTTVDDEEYFSTLESHSVLMLLAGEQQWSDAKGLQYTVQIGDETDAAATTSCSAGSGDGSSSPRGRRCQLLQRLRADPGYIALLGGCDLELLSELSPDAAPGYESGFVEDIQEASCRYLDGRRDVEEALSFIKCYKNTGS